MWQALRDIVNNVKESVGIEVPAVPDPAVVTGAADQAGDAATAAADAVSSAGVEAATAASDAAGGVADSVGGAGESIVAAGEQITTKVSDFLGRLGG